MHVSGQKEFIFSSIVLLGMALASVTGCASSKKAEPDPLWLTDLESAYPKNDYLVQVGNGTTASEAKTVAMAELASFFNVTIQRTILGESSILQNGDQTQSSKKITTSTVTVTDLDIFGMETTEPFLKKDKNGKKWYCAAFINRENAWNQYEPSVTAEKNKFYSVYNLTQTTDEPFAKIKLYRKAQNQSSSFTDSLYKADMLSKALTAKAFGDDRILISQIEGKIQEQLNRCTMYISVSEDISNIIKAAISRNLSKMGFTVTDNQKNALYNVNGLIEYNRADEEDLIVIHPELTVIMEGPENFNYAFDGKADKALSYNLSKAKKNSCESLVKVIDENFIEDFENATGIKGE